MKRREFLKKTGVITAGSLLLPSFLRANSFSNSLVNGMKRLVIVQLSGGNDGINTVVPYGLDEYYNNRIRIGLKEESLLKINHQFGFNPALKGLYKLHQEGMVSLINSVGYPNPSRSHFRSMDIWHTASNSEEYKTSGWIGQYLDSYCQNAYQAIELNGNLSLALKGKTKSGIAFTNPEAFYKSINAPFYQELKAIKTTNTELDFMYKVFNDTKNSAKYIYDQHQLVSNTVDYGRGVFGQQLKEIATLIQSDIQTPVFYTALKGFDTHVNQLGNHNRLLKLLDEGLSAFVADLEKDDLMKETTILVFSEFGRRLKENASRGTDHGAANISFVIDKNLSQQAHQFNTIDLSDLHRGDPKYQVDFRSIYQELLTHRLNVDAKKVLGKSYQSLGLF
ncbi:MAG: DUF1501 domain-containing protein [Flavobacteriales bacterium]|jgi:uncharacterized protein (DUF1501 family)|nr:DUF1501 domain-containing protein [Flavobacteriales bacterium]